MNIQNISEEYVLSHPSIRNSIGLVNYSKLARKIIEETELTAKNFDAIIISLRRIEHKLKKNDNTKKILAILKKTKLEIRNKILVTIIEKRKINIDIEDVTAIEGSKVITLISPDDQKDNIKKRFRLSIIRQTSGLVEIILRSPEELELEPGVMGYLYSIFAEHQINIVETMSCWTDTIFIIDRKDLEKSVNLLNFS